MEKTGQKRISSRLIKSVLRAYLLYPELADSRSLSVLLREHHSKVKEILNNKHKYLKLFTREELLCNNLR